MRCKRDSHSRIGLGNCDWTVHDVPGRLLSLGTFLLLASIITSALAAQVVSIESAIRNRQYDEALSMADSVLQKDPGNYRVWALKGIALSLKGETPPALEAFQRSLALSPEYPPAMEGEAELLYQAGDKRAIPLLQAILEVNPADLTAHEMLGVAQAKQENCDGAIPQFQLVEKTVASHPESLEWYGYCLMRDKHFAQSVTAFEQLVKLLPEKPYARYDLALVQTLAGKNEDAIGTLQPLLSGETAEPNVVSLASEAYEAAAIHRRRSHFFDGRLFFNRATPTSTFVLPGSVSAMTLLKRDCIWSTPVLRTSQKSPACTSCVAFSMVSSRSTTKRSRTSKPQKN